MGPAVALAFGSVAGEAASILTIDRLGSAARRDPELEQDEPRGPRFFWHRRSVAVADLASAAIALIAVRAIFGHADAATPLLFAVLVLVLGKLTSLYARGDLRLMTSTLDEMPSLMSLTGLSALAIAIAQPAFAKGNLSGLQIAITWLALFLAIVLGRMILRCAGRWLSPTERCLVIGDPREAQRIDDRLRMGGTRARVIAAIPTSGEDRRTLAELSSEVVISKLVRDLGADRIILTAPHAHPADAINLVRAAKATSVPVSLAPGLLDFGGSTIEIDEVNGLRLVGVRSFGLSPTSRVLKRSFDLVFGTIGLLAILPVLTLIAIAIRRDSDGPVFFRQTRVGRDGRQFTIIKFRSMVIGADAQKESLRGLSEAGEGLFKISDDPRVTRVGRFLRRTSLDELPQIFNVVRGEMSLVGPRPLVVEEDASIRGLDRFRLVLTPGMTGPWQVMPRRVPVRDMVEMDYRYADNWSLWLDLKILIRTGIHVIRRANH